MTDLKTILDSAFKNHADPLVQRNPQTCYTQIERDVIVLNVNDDTLYHFNETAVDLWLSLDIPRTISQLTQLLEQKYEGPIETYQHDVQTWVADMNQKGLLSLNQSLEF